MRPIRRIIIHHSAGPRSQTLEQITKFHTDPPPSGRGWNAIGYHLVVLGTGAVRAGRDIRVPGAHAHGANFDSIGICLVGNNTVTAEAWNQPQIRALRAVIRGILTEYPECEVLGHRDVPGSATLCPGLDVRALLAKEE